jgi:hypothetical protein
MLDCDTPLCGFGFPFLPWQEDEMHVVQKEKEATRLEDQDLEKATNKLIEERDVSLKQCSTAEEQVRIYDLYANYLRWSTWRPG